VARTRTNSAYLPVCLHLHRYIKWTQEQCCVQGGKAELQAVLESATSSLTAAARYHGDVRLLRIWVQYVSAGRHCMLPRAPLFFCCASVRLPE
jgi:hypothetical protein